MDSAEDTAVLAEDTPLRRRAGETSAVAALIPAAGDITAAVDTTAQDSDLAWAYMRPTAMRLRRVIPRDSMTRTASGSIIRVARFRTGIES
jgi:hypothetical protein